MLAFNFSAIADRGLRMYRHNQPDKIRFVGLITLAMLVGLFAGGRQALAQSLDDSSARASDSAVTENTIPSSVGSADTDTPDAPADADEAITASSVDDSAAHPTSNSGVASPPSDGSAGSDETSGPGTENGAVLELPQVVNPSTGSTVDRSPDGASAGAEDNDDDTAQSDQVGQDTAAERDLAATADQVGTLEDYENQVAEAPPGVIFIAPATVVRFPRPAPFNPAVRPPFGVPLATSPIILPPRSSGPFPSTSPMLMAPSPMLMTPRFATFGSFRGGGFMGVHR
jgi:hypothetical protein